MADDFDEAAQKKGRPEFAPSESDMAEARRLAASGASDDAIAGVLGVSTPTLRKHCGDAIAEGRAEVQPSLFSACATTGPEASAPAPAPLKRGRKRHAPTSSDRSRVRLWAAAKLPHAVMAKRLGISEPTLRRAYSDDLAEAEALARAEIIDNLHRQMVGGSTSAAKALKDIVDEAAIPASPAIGPAAKPERETLGKKAMQVQAAKKEVEGGAWSKKTRLAQLN